VLRTLPAAAHVKRLSVEPRMSSINRHFKLESWLMVGAILVPIALGIGAAFVVPWIQTLVASDRCLDAGGSYDYKTEICIGTPSR